MRHASLLVELEFAHQFDTPAIGSRNHRYSRAMQRADLPDAISGAVGFRQ
jgi:hypothetical protein